MGATTVGEWVAIVRTAQYVECATIREKFRKHNIFVPIIGIDI